MKITTVTYQKAFNIGPFLQEKVGIEIQIDDTETAESALDLAKMIVESWHKANNPHLEGMVIKDVVEDIDEQEAAKKDAEFAKAIDDVEKIEFKEDAITYLNNNGWTYNIELKNKANSKPSKNA